MSNYPERLRGWLCQAPVSELKVLCRDVLRKLGTDCVSVRTDFSRKESSFGHIFREQEMRELVKLLLDFVVVPVADKDKRGLISTVASVGTGKTYFCNEVAMKFSASLLGDPEMRSIAMEEVRAVVSCPEFMKLNDCDKTMAERRIAELVDGGTHVVLLSMNSATSFSEDEARLYRGNIKLTIMSRLLYSFLCTPCTFDLFLAAISGAVLQQLAAVPLQEILDAMLFVCEKKACFVILDETKRLADYQDCAIPNDAGSYLYPLRDINIAANEGKNKWRAIVGGLEALSAAINRTAQVFVLVTSLAAGPMLALQTDSKQVVLPLPLRPLMGKQYVVERAIHLARAGADSARGRLPIVPRPHQVTALLTLVGMHPRSVARVAQWLSTEKDRQEFTVAGVLKLLRKRGFGVRPEAAVAMRAVLGETFSDDELQGLAGSMGVLNVIHNNDEVNNTGVLLLAPVVVIAAHRSMGPLFQGLILDGKHFERYFIEWCKAQCLAASLLGKEVRLADFVKRVGSAELEEQIDTQMGAISEKQTHYLYRKSGAILEPSMSDVLAVVGKVGSMSGKVRESSCAPEYDASTGGECFVYPSSPVNPGFDGLFSSGDGDNTTAPVKALVAVQLKCRLATSQVEGSIGTSTVLDSVVRTADALHKYLDNGWECALLFCAFKTRANRNTLLFDNEQAMRLELGAAVHAVCATGKAHDPRKYTDEYRRQLGERAVTLLKRTMVITRRGLRSFFGLTCAAALESQLGFWWSDADAVAAMEESAALYSADELTAMCGARGVSSGGSKREMLERYGVFVSELLRCCTNITLLLRRGRLHYLAGVV
jgi:hypothetical protein